jgi:hypothetical protein
MCTFAAAKGKPEAEIISIIEQKNLKSGYFKLQNQIR